MQLDFSGEEKEFLVTLLNKEYQDTLAEIRHTDMNSFKVMLKQRESMLEEMLAKVQ